mgnify:CR=1 FL=1
MKTRTLIIILGLVIALFSISAAAAQESITAINLQGAAINVDGAGAVVSGSTVTITTPGTYSLSGTLDDGQILVDAEQDGLVTLILNGVTLNSSTSAPLYIKKASIAAIILADGTQNSVTDAAAYIYPSADEDEPNAAIFSDDDLTISGSGALNVVANYNDGIASKDSLTIADSVIAVTSVDDGIRGKDSLVITAANLTINAQGDGLKSDNEDDTSLGYITIESGLFNIIAGGDALQAQTTLTINTGDFNLTSGGGSSAVINADHSAKGLKADVSVIVNGGTFVINSADDALHSNGSVSLNAGAFTIATADDGIHADTSITINGGLINIAGSYEGIESAVITINAGDIHLVSSDDGINVAGGSDAAQPQGGPPAGNRRQDRFAAVGDYYLYINGGTIVVNANGDGLDANGSIEMSGGLVLVNGPTENMNGALDYDGYFNITGGTFIAVGSAGMAQTAGDSSTQHALLLNLNAGQAAGTPIHIETADGQQVLTFLPAKAYQSIAFSSPQLSTGTTYNVYIGGTVTGTTVDGLAQTDTYTPGSQYTGFTISSIITLLGETRGWRP